MIWLYAIGVLPWLAVLVFMGPAVWSIYIQQTHRGDQARLVCFLFALLMEGFMARRIASGEPVDTSMTVLLVASAAIAIFTITAAANYGRGDRV